MKNKILCLCLALTMLFGMMSGMSLTAFADGDETDGAGTTTVNATDDTKARDFTDRNFDGGTDFKGSFPGGEEGIEGIQGFIGGNTLEYDDILFSGDERTFSIDFSIHGQYYANFNVYLDSKDNDHLILAAREVSAHEYGWGALKTVELTLEVRPEKGTHTVILEGLNTTEKVENPEGWGAGTSGFTAFRFVEGKWPTVINATAEVLATSANSFYYPTHGDMWKQGYVYNAKGQTGLEGVSGFVGGAWMKYENIVFTGKEGTFSIDYSIQSYNGIGKKANFNVYLDEIKEENLIVAAKDQSTNTGWTDLDTLEFTLEKPIKGTHAVIIEGLDNTIVSSDWSDTLAGFYAFRFVNGKWATDEILATTTNEFYYPTHGDMWKQGYVYNAKGQTGLEGVSGLVGGAWMKYTNVMFTGNEKTFSIDYSINSYNGISKKANFNVYLDEIKEENLIVAAKDQSTNTGWTDLDTLEFTLEKPIKGTHAVIIEGLDNTIVSSDWSDTLAGFYAFRFVNGEWPMTISAPAVKLNGADVDWANAFSEEGTYTVSVEIANAPATAKLYVAVYSANKKLIAAQGSTTLGDGTQSVELVIPEGTVLTGATAKAFVWTADMEPLAKF